ncbi:hypothetical protein GCM10009549_52150 [Streptomyces thermoalcalitolerans]|uniref:Uncharacterized protein n=1 Tax=Streptomyces thermoalcalitolerans TaxID=65605 RepID=A0ABP3ZZI3_9ACTN
MEFLDRERLEKFFDLHDRDFPLRAEDRAYCVDCSPGLLLSAVCGAVPGMCARLRSSRGIPVVEHGRPGWGTDVPECVA